jgi:acetyl esterase/lipase
MNLISCLLWFNLINGHPVPAYLAMSGWQDPNVITDIEYYQAPDDTGKMVSLQLDVYKQPAAGPDKRPVIILVHGGGFVGGDKGYTPSQGNFYPDLATAFASHGYVVFSINYRLNMIDYLGAALEDVHHALEWIKAHHETYRIDTTKVLISGDSAGGAIVVNASLRNPELHSFAGCMDMWGGLPPYGNSNNTGPVNTFPINGETPPTCIIHGTEDRVVQYLVSQNLCDSLARAGVYNEFHPLDGAGHYPNELEDQIIPILIDFADKIILPISSCSPKLEPW